MKVSRIELKDYQQFKSVDLNLTYPLGHKLEGKPLDKVCFIGQSGTGKTTLLRLIKYFVTRNKLIGRDLHINIPERNKVFFELYHGELFTRKTVDTESFWVDKYTFKGEKVGFEEYLKKADEFENKFKPFLINYPAEVIRGKSKNEILETKEIKDKKIKDRLDFISNLEPQEVVDFAVEEIEKVRDFVFKEIKEHKAKELEMSNRLIKEAKSNSSVIRERNEWYKNNPNPLIKLAEECLDPILNRFGLKVKTEIDFETILDLGDIQLQTLNGVDVERTFWSTGTRQMVDTLLPLFELRPQNAIVLMDEPERSLYPDIQEIAIKLYQNLAPTCQFFYATHSPIIASSFDPWEIFQLEYDNFDNSVYSVKNFEGERHIDNYNYYPKYLRWDSILMNVFKLSDEGNSERESILLKVATLKREIGIMISEKKQHTVKFKKKKEEFIKLSNKVGWDEGNI